MALTIFLCIGLTCILVLTMPHEYNGKEKVGEHVIGRRIFSEASYEFCSCALVPLALGTGGVAVALMVGQLRREDCG